MDANRPAEAVIGILPSVAVEACRSQGRSYNLALALAKHHQVKEAISHYRAALGLKPDFTQALNNLAWILATDPNPELRDSKESVELAEKACQITSNTEAGPVLTLATAIASAGQFTNATVMVQKARDLALAARDKDTAAKADGLLKLYESGQPYRESN